MSSPRPEATPAALTWRRIRRNRPAFAALVVLSGLYAVAIAAPFLAPCGPERMDRERFYHPPQRLH